MSKSNLNLQEDDTTDEFDFPPPERKIFTQPYDLSLVTLIEQWKSGNLELPDMQREYVWDNGRASRLIESFILNIPVPPIYFAETEDAVLQVIDGNQRVQSIVRYFNNEFALSGLRVLSEYSRKRFHELPEREQRFLRNRTIRAIVISHDSHPNMKFEVFERLNTGGIALNAQELRNSLYRGKLNEKLKVLAKDHAFRECIGTQNPRRRMVDDELILRWFAMYDDLPDYRPPLKRFLNEYMDRNRDQAEEWLSMREDIFRGTMKRINRILGPRAFRLIDPTGDPLNDEHGKPFPRSVNRALYDAQSLSFSWVISDEEEENNKEVIKTIGEVLTHYDFQEAVRRATGNKDRLFLRVNMMVAALEKAGLRIDLPYALVE